MFLDEGFEFLELVEVQRPFAIGRDEAHFRQKILDQAVLGRGQVFADQPAQAADTGAPRHLVDGELFHPTLQDATTHDPSVNKRALLIKPAEDYDGDQSVVAEFIPQMQGHGNEFVRLVEPFDVCLSIADGAEVELVGALGELGNARNGEFFEAADDRGHFEAGEVIVDGGEGLLEINAGEFLLVLAGAPQVFLRKGGGFEQIERAQIGDVEGRVFRQFRDRDGREQLAHQVALKWIIVQKNHRIQSDVQDLLNALDVLGFVVPVGDKNSDVLQPQRHFRMIAEGLFGRVLVVLAAHGENDAPVLQLPGPLLQGIVGVAQAQFPDFDVLHPIVANDATPKRGVQIEHEAFADGAADGLDDVNHRLGRDGQEIKGQGHSGGGIKAGIVRGRVASVGGEAGKIGDEDVLFRLGQGHQFAVNFLDLEGKRGGALGGEMAEDPVIDLHKVEVDDFGLAETGDGFPPAVNFVQDARAEIGAGVQRRGGKAGPEAFRGEIKHDKFGLEMIHL